MGTKNNPGNYDCYTNAEPDEPMFVLLGRDQSAQFLTAAWAAIKCGDMTLATRLVCDSVLEQKERGKPFREPTDAKIIEANQCAKAMRVWIEDKQRDAIEERLSEEQSTGFPFDSSGEKQGDSH